MSAMPQNYENHRKFVPLYHFVAFPVLAINLIWSLYVVVTSFSVGSVIGVLLAVALVILFLYTRLFALAVQDRVIRLEEHLRLGRLLPPEQQDGMQELTIEQLIGLRFASDGEVAELVSAVVEGGIRDREEIKKRVKHWRADHQRA